MHELGSLIIQRSATTSWGLRTLLALIIAFTSTITLLGWGNSGDLPAPVMLTILVLVSATLIASMFTYSEVSVHERGVEVRWFPLHKKQLSFDEIDRVSVVTLPLSYGIGLRFYGGGEMGLIGRSGHGVKIELTGEGSYSVTVDSRASAEAVAAAIEEARVARK